MNGVFRARLDAFATARTEVREVGDGSGRVDAQFNDARRSGLGRGCRRFGRGRHELGKIVRIGGGVGLGIRWNTDGL